MLTLVRILRNLCRLNQYYVAEFEERYRVPWLTSDQMEFIQYYIIPFLKNHESLVHPLDVV